MLHIVAKKYTQALMDSVSDLDEVLHILKGFSNVLREKKNADIIASPFLSKSQKEQFLLESVSTMNIPSPSPRPPWEPSW